MRADSDWNLRASVRAVMTNIYVVLVSQGDYECHEYIGIAPTLVRAKALADAHLQRDYPARSFTDWRRLHSHVAARESDDKLKLTANCVEASNWSAIIIEEGPL